MIITTISKSRIQSMTLPQKIKGQYWIYDSEFDGDTRMVSVEGINNAWILKSTRQEKIQ